MKLEADYENAYQLQIRQSYKINRTWSKNTSNEEEEILINNNNINKKDTTDNILPCY